MSVCTLTLRGRDFVVLKRDRRGRERERKERRERGLYCSLIREIEGEGTKASEGERRTRKRVEYLKILTYYSSSPLSLVNYGITSCRKRKHMILRI